MSEEAFARSVLALFEADRPLQNWYHKFLEGRNLGGTLGDLYLGIARGELRIDQALLLALFIGLTTERKSKP